jgi:3-oxoacyl-[acyl-carrier-protein] synthase-3
VYGLFTANAMVRSGAVKHVLLVGAEKHSAALDLSTKGRSVSSLFGDGAGAVVVSATEEDRGIRCVFVGSDGRYADVLAQKIWDIRQRPFMPVDENGVGQIKPEMMWAQMEGRVVFKHAVEHLITSLMQACWDQGLNADDIDLFVFHQANLRVNQYVAEQLQLPDSKVVHNIERYGNTTAATIPILLAESERDGKLKRGMKVALVAFGSGFTWGASIIDW